MFILLMKEILHHLGCVNGAGVFEGGTSRIASNEGGEGHFPESTIYIYICIY